MLDLSRVPLYFAIQTWQSTVLGAKWISGSCCSSKTPNVVMSAFLDRSRTNALLLYHISLVAPVSQAGLREGLGVVKPMVNTNNNLSKHKHPSAQFDAG